MDATTLTLEISQVVTVLVTFGSLLKIHYSMREKMSLQNQEIEYLKNQCNEVKEDFDKLESEVKDNKENFSTQYNELGKEIGKLYTKIETTKGEILQAIANIK